MSGLRLVGLWMAVVLATSVTTWTVIRDAGNDVTTQPATTTPGSASALPQASSSHPADRGAKDRRRRRAHDEHTERAGGGARSSRPSPGGTPTATPGASGTGAGAGRDASSASGGSGSSGRTGSGTGGGSSATTTTRSWQGSAGTVVTECTGSRIELRGAQANPGWRVQVEERGPEEVSVHFEQGGDGAEAEVRARCTGGEPRYEASGDD